MNDDLSPIDGPTDRGPVDDDLVSAVLDGVATPTERALVEGSTEGRRRLEELRAAAAAVSTPVTPLADPSVDSMVARALAEAATPVVVGVTSPSETTLDELGQRRERRASTSGLTWRRALGAVAAVAAVIVVIAGVAALARSGTSRSSDSASSASSGGSSSAQATGGVGESTGAADSAAPVAGPVPPDLGPLADAQTVLDRYGVLVGADLSVDHQFDSAASATVNGATGPPSEPVPVPLGCPVPPDGAGVATGERWSVTADARLPEGPVVVMSNGLAPGMNRVLVVDAATCAVLAERTI